MILFCPKCQKNVMGIAEYPAEFVELSIRQASGERIVNDDETINIDSLAEGFVATGFGDAAVAYTCPNCHIELYREKERD